MTADAAASTPQGHPLANSWCIWEHVETTQKDEWGDNMHVLCEVNSVEHFWRYFNNIPKPSQTFFDGMNRKKIGGRKLDGFSIFKKGIRPEWEDAQNAVGGEWTCRQRMQVQLLDIYWENLVLGLIGETIDVGDDVCGARVTDKSKGTHAMYRLELWLKTRDETAAARIMERMLACLSDQQPDRGSLPDFSWKDH